MLKFFFFIPYIAQVFASQDKNFVQSIAGKKVRMSKVNYTMESVATKGAFSILYNAFSDDGRKFAIQVGNNEYTKERLLRKNQGANSLKTEIDILKTLGKYVDHTVINQRVFILQTAVSGLIMSQLNQKTTRVSPDQIKKLKWFPNFIHEEISFTHNRLTSDNLLFDLNKNIIESIECTHWEFARPISNDPILRNYETVKDKSAIQSIVSQFVSKFVDKRHADYLEDSDFDSSDDEEDFIFKIDDLK